MFLQDRHKQGHNVTGTALIPWTRTLSQLAACFFATGTAAGLTNAGVNTLVVHLWQEASAPPLYLLHFGFGLGAFLSPLLARPFISDDTTTENETTFNLTTDNSEQLFHDETPTSSTLVPYSCVAVVYTLFALAMLTFHIIGLPRHFPTYMQDKQLKAMFSPRNWSPKHPGYASVILALMFSMFMQGVGAELVFGNFIFSFATDADVAFSKDSAAMLTSLFWLCHMIGRLAGALLGLCVATSVVLLGDILLLTLTSLFLVLFGHSHPSALWLLAAAYGFFISPLVPAGNHWTSLQISVNPMSTTVLFLGTSAGLFVYVYIAGRLMENFGPESIMKFLLFCGIGLIASMISALVVARKHWKLREDENEASKAEKTEMIVSDKHSIDQK